MLFNKIVPSYSESYYQEIKKLKIEVVESFAYLRGMRYTDDENYLEYENVEVGRLKGYLVVWRAAILRSGALGNTEKSPIHVVDNIRMIGRSTHQGVGNEMLLKYGGAVNESNEYKENERSVDQGMMKRKDRADGEKNTRAYQEEQFATDSRRVCVGVQLELNELSAICHGCAVMLKEKRAICRGFQKGFAWDTSGTARAFDWKQSATDSRSVLRGDEETIRSAEGEQSAADSKRVLRGGTGGTARLVDWEQSATDSRSVLRGGTGGTVRATEEEQSAAYSRRVLRGGTTSELRDNAVAELRETNAGHLGINTDKRIRIQRRLTTMSTLGGMINAAIELGCKMST